jgi:hypothetical protein
MRPTLSVMLLAAIVSAGAAVPAAAQSKEQRQLMADLRILQEQSQVMQNLINQLSEALKAVNGRLDDQAGANRKAFADQKLTIDTLSSDLRVVREKVDDNNVRIGSLTQELESVRRAVSQANMLPPPASEGATGSNPAEPGSPATSVALWRRSRRQDLRRSARRRLARGIRRPPTISRASTISRFSDSRPTSATFPNPIWPTTPNC